MYGKIEELAFTLPEIIRGMARQIKEYSSNESIDLGVNEHGKQMWLELADIDALCEDLQSRAVYADQALTFIAKHRESGYVSEDTAIDLQLDMEWIRDMLGWVDPNPEE